MLNWLRKNKIWVLGGVAASVSLVLAGWFLTAEQKGETKDPSVNSAYQSHTGMGDDVHGDNISGKQVNIDQRHNGTDDTVGMDNDAVLNTEKIGDEALRIKKGKGKQEGQLFKSIQQSRTTKLVGVFGSQAWKHGGDWYRSITTVAVSSDGKQGISGGHDGAIYLWDLTTGESLRTLSSPDKSWIEHLEFFPDGKSVLVARINGPLEIIDVASGTVTQQIDTGPSGVRHANLLPDGKGIVVSPYKYPIFILNVPDGTWLKTLTLEGGGKQQISSLAVSPDGKRVLVGTSKSVDIFAVDSGKHLLSIFGFTGYVASIAVAKDGKRFLAGTGDGKLRLFDLESGKEIRSIKHWGRIEAIAFSNDGKRAVMGSDRHSFGLFDLNDGQAIWRSNNRRVDAIALTPDGKGIFTGNSDKTVMLWDLETGIPRGKIIGHKKKVNSLAFWGDRVVTGSSDDTILVWDPNGRKAKEVLSGRAPSYFRANQDASILAFTDKQRGIVVYDLNTDQEQTLRASENVRSIWMDSKGETIIGREPPPHESYNGKGWDHCLGILKEWNLTTGKGPHELMRSIVLDQPNYSKIIQPSAKIALEYSYKEGPGKLQLWDLEKGKPTKTLDTTVGANGFITPHVISTDGTLGVTSKNLMRGRIEVLPGKEVKLWDLKSGKVLTRYPIHNGDVVAALLSTDNKRLITASRDRKIRFFGTESPELIDQIDLGTIMDSPCTLALSKDEKSLLVGTARGIALRFELL